MRRHLCTTFALSFSLIAARLKDAGRRRDTARWTGRDRITITTDACFHVLLRRRKRYTSAPQCGRTTTAVYATLTLASAKNTRYVQLNSHAIWYGRCCGIASNNICTTSGIL